LLLISSGCGPDEQERGRHETLTTDATATATQSSGKAVFQRPQVTVRLTDQSDGVSLPLTANLVNQGAVSVVIKSVDKECACVRLANDVSGQILVPSQSLDIRLSVTPPPVGTKLTRVTVHTDPPSTDAVLEIEAIGRPIVPPVVDSVGRHVDVYADGEAPITARGTFSCIEHADGPPWITGLQIVDKGVRGWTGELNGAPTVTGGLPDAGLEFRSYGFTVRGVPDFRSDSVQVLTALPTTREETPPWPDSESILIRIHHSPRLRPIPAELVWNLAQNQRERSLLLRFSRAAEWKVTFAGSDLLLVAVANQDQPTTAVPVTLRLRDGEVPSGRVELTFQAESESAERLSCRVPVTFRN
jgi:hypothetical protein